MRNLIAYLGLRVPYYTEREWVCGEGLEGWERLT